MPNTDFMKPLDKSVAPPDHTQVRIRCATCSKWPVCSIRDDYLKTAQLIQNILGAPADNYEISPLPIYIPNFEGTKIENWNEYFPETITTENERTGKFQIAKYCYSNCDCKNSEIKFVYLIDEQYYVLFTTSYKKDDTNIEIPTGKEVFYNIDCKIKQDDNYELLSIGLASLKEDIEEIESKKEKQDIINTTAFSVQLDCKFYEWEKGLKYEQGLDRITVKPKIPCDCYEHLATYHIEPNQVPCYYHRPTPPMFMPMPYYCAPPKPPRTRDELNEF